MAEIGRMMGEFNLLSGDERAEQECQRADAAQAELEAIIQNLLASGMSLAQVSQVTGRSEMELMGDRGELISTD
jgi:hypothetical protein